MLMMLLIEQKLDFEVHLMLFHLNFHYPMIPLLLMMEENLLFEFDIHLKQVMNAVE